VLLKGRADKGMPAFSTLTEGQLRDIAEFLHLKVELAANRGTYHTLNVVTGDAKKGEAYFNGAGGCNACIRPPATWHMSPAVIRRRCYRTAFCGRAVLARVFAE